MAATSWAVRPCLAWYAARAFLIRCWSWGGSCKEL